MRGSWRAPRPRRPPALPCRPPPLTRPRHLLPASSAPQELVQESLQPLEDDCALLGSLLDKCLELEIGAPLFAKFRRLRALSDAAARVGAAGDADAAALLADRMSDELMALPLEEALPVVRAFGHYLNLTSIAEMHHSARAGAVAAAADGGPAAHSADGIFLHLIERGVERDRLHEFVSTELHVEVVLTAHPTQVNRRTLQHKFTRIAQLLAEKDAPGLAEGRRGALLEDLRREVTALWQTDELRRRKPTPLDEARGGLHIVEQSLWSAVPEHLRRTSAALLRHTGRGLPIDAKPVRFSSWMGGDRDGNPNVTAKVTHDVACLARWMGADLYLKEVDALRFELSMTHASDELWRLARDVAARHAAEAEAAAAAGHGGGGPREGPAGGGGAPAPDAPDGAGAEEESLLVAGASFAMSPRALSAALAAGGGSGAALASAGGSPAGLSPVGSLAAQGSAMSLDRYAVPSSPRGAASARGSLDGRPPPAGAAGANGSVPASPRPARAAPRALTPDQLRRRGAQAARRGKTTIEALLHPRAAGAAPYRIVLGELRARLLATKRRMEARSAASSSRQSKQNTASQPVAHRRPPN
jgi:phosphoenolpyruvate carboxylase